MIRLILVALLQLAMYAHSSEDWCYLDSACEPSTWSLHYDSCNLNWQSPINIVTNNVVTDANLRPIQITGVFGSSEAVVSNNGHTVEVTLSSDYILTGASLADPHKLAGFHIHFGSTQNNIGSEHYINNQGYPLEIHYVFYNTKYQDLTTAKTQSDGLAVVGALFQVRYEIFWL
ncbi:carbonic anhydrase 4 [Pelobates cultripes]|uniref:Carbonic anhydrase 4 n=1 Tax=Pelobates cultripes TaxID=61616 RepID=A0AAD1WP83_PELCU|nr:carbonic anhydrase 4 [Pelobates cultripes]